MSLNSSLVAVRSFIISNIAGFTTSNCSIADESVFSYIQGASGASDKCCIVTPEQFSSVGASEFRSATIDWAISVNAFFMISDGDIKTATDNAIAFIDSFVQGVATDPVLGSSVMSARVSGGGPILTYQRGNFYYIIAPVDVVVRDNIS